MNSALDRGLCCCTRVVAGDCLFCLPTLFPSVLHPRPIFGNPSLIAPQSQRVQHHPSQSISTLKLAQRVHLCSLERRCQTYIARQGSLEKSRSRPMYVRAPGNIFVIVAVDQPQPHSRRKLKPFSGAWIPIRRLGFLALSNNLCVIAWSLIRYLPSYSSATYHQPRTDRTRSTVRRIVVL